MNKKNIATSLLLSICLIFTVAGASPTYATAPCTNKAVDPNQYQVIEPHEIGRATIHLERRNASTLFYRVTAQSISGVNTSMSATIVLQRLDNGRWVNVQTINRSVNNAFQFDFSDTIDMRTHGSGSYRIRTMYQSVTGGMTFNVGPLYSLTVII